MQAAIATPKSILKIRRPSASPQAADSHTQNKRTVRTTNEKGDTPTLIFNISPLPSASPAHSEEKLFSYALAPQTKECFPLSPPPMPHFISEEEEESFATRQASPPPFAHLERRACALAFFPPHWRGPRQHYDTSPSLGEVRKAYHELKARHTFEDVSTASSPPNTAPSPPKPQKPFFSFFNLFRSPVSLKAHEPPPKRDL